MRRVALHNLGCKVNSYETEAMEQLMEQNGYHIVPFHQKADIYIINTCTVTNIADRKSRQMLHKAKKMNPDAIVVAAGCYVQIAEKELLEDMAVDIVIGNNQKGELLSILQSYEETHMRSLVIDINDTNEYENLKIERTGEHNRAFIKIQDGCNQFCSYCIIPFARGRVRSRNPQEVLEEVNSLVKNGYKELVLTGIHLSSYGIDFSKENHMNLLDLIVEIHKIEGLKRIRFGSLEPRIVTEEFVSTLSKLDKICPHFHLSLQSGSDETLKRMNRRYDTEEYYNSCQLLRNYFHHPAITTDVIVGFPGESEEEFGQTKAFLQKVGLSEMHVFKYSKREGTKAATMEGQISDQIKAIRSNELLELGKDMSELFIQQYNERVMEVLIEEEMEMDGKKWFVGYSREYTRVVISDPDIEINQIVYAVPTGRKMNGYMVCKIQKEDKK